MTILISDRTDSRTKKHNEVTTYCFNSPQLKTTDFKLQCNQYNSFKLNKAKKWT